MSRPELTGHASLFYNEKEARKYDSSSRMIGVQREITERAVELLRLDDSKPSLVLDIGCGSGLSGQVLEERGHVWLGCDVSRDMLTVAKERMDRQARDAREQLNAMTDGDEKNIDGSSDEEDTNVLQSTGDLMHHDMGSGLPFRPATFDACISISALQWLCYSNSAAQNPRKRLTRFFSSLYTVLKRGGRAVLQFYPETAEQAVLISETATKVGFAGGVVVDYPNSAKAKKHYLVLSFERSLAPRRGALGTAEQDQKQQHVTVGEALGSNKGKKQPPRKRRASKQRNGFYTKRMPNVQRAKTFAPTRSTRRGEGVESFSIRMLVQHPW